MKTLRGVPETGLFVISGLIEPSLARDFQDEWVAQLFPSNKERLESPGNFFEEDHGITNILNRSDLEATHRILELLQLVALDDVSVGINFQAPKSKQKFHLDNPTRDNVVYVVHGEDGGVFDYAPGTHSEREAERNHLSADMNAGDVLVQTQQQLLHRGRNGSDSPRVTAAIARVDSTFYYDKYV